MSRTASPASVASTISRWVDRGTERSGRSTNTLTIVAVAAATLVVLLTVSVGVGLGHRIDRSRWTHPQPSPDPSITQITTTRYLGDRLVRIVHLAPANGSAEAETGRLPVPPGMDHFPTAGEQWVSPALADLTRKGDPVADVTLAPTTGGAAQPDGTRQPDGTARPDGILGRDALSGPDELMAVIGHDANDPVMSGPTLHDLMRADDHIGPIGIDGFEGASPGDDNELVQYRWLTFVATVLLVVPALSLAAAGARLGAARRSRRLALLRLAGLDRSTLVRVTSFEAVRPAIIGAAAGTLLHLALLPIAARVPLVGTRWFAGDLLVGLPILAAVWMTLLALCAVSALVPVRAILADPIATADNHVPAPPRWWRVLATGGAIAGFLVLTNGDDVSIWMVLIALAIMFTTLNVVGPVVVRITGWAMVRRAPNGVRLIAGRRLLDDPNGAWRQIAAVTLAAFIAGFLALFTIDAATTWRGDTNTLTVAVAADRADAAAENVRVALRDAGIDTHVRTTGSGGALDTVIAQDGDIAYLAIGTGSDFRTSDANTSGSATGDAIRRVVARTLPTSPQTTVTDVMGRDERFANDFRTATIVILAAAFTVAAIGTAITSAATVIDRRSTYQRLHRAGVPFDLLDGSRTTQVMTPTLLGTIGGAAMGLVAASPITLGSAGIDLGGAALLAGTIAVGVVAVRLGVVASRPTLRRVTTA